MIKYSRNDLIHWNYFIALERDLENVSRYIEFSTKNEKTYSIEIAKILMSSSSEIDVLLKMICSLYNTSTDSINQYRDCIKANCPQIIDEEFYINRFSLSSKPWINWNSIPIKNPDWWTSYNNVKHQRNLYYEDANIKNVINSLAALLITNIYYYKIKSGNDDYKDTTRQLVPESILYKLKDKYYYSNVLVGSYA